MWYRVLQDTMRLTSPNPNRERRCLWKSKQLKSLEHTGPGGKQVLMLWCGYLAESWYFTEGKIAEIKIWMTPVPPWECTSLASGVERKRSKGSSNTRGRWEFSFGNKTWRFFSNEDTGCLSPPETSRRAFKPSSGTPPGMSADTAWANELLERFQCSSTWKQNFALLRFRDNAGHVLRIISITVHYKADWVTRLRRPKHWMQGSPHRSLLSLSGGPCLPDLHSSQEGPS